jgi:hypothetical protein
MGEHSEQLNLVPLPRKQATSAPTAISQLPFLELYNGHFSATSLNPNPAFEVNFPS